MTTVQKFPDGHVLSKDPLQWMVTHPSSCKRSKGVNTYFVVEHNAHNELEACGARVRKITLPR